ncbi:tetratricopeptide repeat protein [Thiospirochaeta perfilievii]|uniref:Tetratricopeptide repeat protein n=1 Tax=Thiospirochaeta perfilievii TaxID=252967 RepID=A0A5C1Q8D1_9SPIO|nr:tetratricopeptide repeat protein [Thiospirochaeta perfilievii]QEN03741.1 tetratricopeptide repeat protein [Thiospirochaeta perfilievii]
MKKYAILLTIVLVTFSCSSKKVKELSNQVYETENNNESNRDERVQELTANIKKLEKDLDATLEKYQKIGNFHRALGVKMMHYKMYYKAYEHFSKAIEFYPNSEMLHYYRGIAASQFALSQDVESVKRDYLQRALNSHEYSIQLNPGFVKGLYALSILYIYEFDRPDDAKDLLDRLISISTREFDAMLLRALLYEKDGEYNEALDLYDSVLSQSKKDDHIVRATTHRDEVLSRLTSD